MRRVRSSKAWPGAVSGTSWRPPFTVTKAKEPCRESQTKRERVGEKNVLTKKPTLEKLLYKKTLHGVQKGLFTSHTAPHSAY